MKRRVFIIQRGEKYLTKARGWSRDIAKADTWPTVRDARVTTLSMPEERVLSHWIEAGVPW